MILLTPDLRFALRANTIQRHVTLDRSRRAALRDKKAEPDPMPVVKFFNPLGAATWRFIELDADGDTVFGLADLGFGTPERGSASLGEIASVRLPFGLGIERDTGFETIHPLSVWAKPPKVPTMRSIAGMAAEGGTARVAGSISAAEQILSRTPRVSGTKLPPAGE